MADYPTFSPKAFGTSYLLPPAVSRLPVDLLRTALVTRDPEKIKTAMMQFRSTMASEQPYSAPTNLPQRMWFQQHKKSPQGGINRPDYRDAISSAMSFTSATVPTTVSGDRSGVSGLSAVSTLSLRKPERVPTYAEAAAVAARGGMSFPSPETNTPMPSGARVRVRPVRQPISAPEVTRELPPALAQAQGAAQRAAAASEALRSAMQARDAFRSITRIPR